MTSPVSTQEFLQTLPISEVVAEVKLALVTGNVLLQAEPGAGKSTGLPLALLSSATPANKIVMLEPRRLAAIGVAERLADQLGEPLGQQVGLRMRGQTTVSAATSLEVVTEGVLTRMLQADPSLEGIGLVIFDEFHERSLNADLGLALCREVQGALREDLRLLLMSATLDALELGASMAPITQIECAGRAHPVDIVWLGAAKDELPRRVAAAITTALSDQEGDVLVFLPGISEIDKTARILEPRLNERVLLYRLHGRAERKIQRLATAPAAQNQRRVILSTSIAETSLTIDGVRVVIDAGLERRGRVDSNTGAQRLETVMASQASATQRAGRAGRTAAGVCYRLWSQSDHARRAVSWQAEILRAELSSLVVETGQWGAHDINSLPWLEVPPQASVTRAEKLLTSLGIWHAGRLTDHGTAVARLPVHPRLGHMLLWAAEQGAAELACKLVALLEDGGGKIQAVDLEAHIRAPSAPHRRRRQSQLLKLLRSKEGASRERASNKGAPSLAVLLAQAYPDWIGQRRSGSDAKYQLSCGAGAYVAHVDSLAQSDWLAIASMGGAAKETRVFLACQLDVEELEDWAPQLFTERAHLDWDDRQERVVAESQKLLGKLVVHSKITTDVSDDDKARALLSGIRRRGLNCLPWTEDCREWQARVELMVRLSPSLSSNQALASNLASTWPKVDDASLTDTLDEWLLVWLSGKSSLKAIAQLDLLAILKSMLDYQQSQALESVLPLRYSVPSGSKIKLRYCEGDSPVLSVKLQEMFGCVENPTVGYGQIPLKVELLSPAQRPIQVTKDLVNFWTTSYVQVKKDMKGRYPKHDWPDDPLVATPTAYTKSRTKNRKKSGS